MRTIYARTTSVSVLEPEIAQNFFDANHRSGALRARSKTVDLGLMSSDGELVAAIQFGTPRTEAKRREYSLELLRLAFLKDHRVVGGASKLIVRFIELFNPSDFFTYQDRTGEATAVYEHAGMVLKKKSKKKQYLIAPGKTLCSAARGEYYSMATVVQRGPDALLGTSLGEQFHADGKRKTNPELFLELGWTIEETVGDYIYEWINPSYSFYAYRLTATDSEKYYYGVSHLKHAEASLEECLNDGYWGSGGKKFSNWKAKHADNMEKEVLQIFSRKSEAFALERKLVGTAYRDDPLCLNSAAGGKDGRTNSFGTALALKESDCIEHGMSLHRGTSCVKCLIKASQSIKVCERHGETIHTGSSCYKCASAKSYSLGLCPIHGETIFSGSSCKKCSAAKQFVPGECSIHGETPFKGGRCQKCSVLAAVSVRECPIHGESKFIGEECYRCISGRAKSLAICEVHGESNHVGETCLQCVFAETDVLKECEIHGLTKHRGDNCWACSSSRSIELQNCEIHGLTKYKGDACMKCVSADARSLRNCPIHGEVNHRGSSCDLCTAQRSVSLKICPIHGETKHRGDYCYRCSAARAVHTRHHIKENNPAKDCSYCVEAGLADGLG